MCLTGISFTSYVFIFYGIFKYLSGSTEYDIIVLAVQFGWGMFYAIVILLLIHFASRVSNEVNNISVKIHSKNRDKLSKKL